MQFISRIFVVGIFAYLLFGCIEVEPQFIASIPNAENLRLSSDGRLFVSGADAVHEIVPGAGGGYTTPAVIEGECSYFGGLAQLHDWMFAVCVKVNPTFNDGRLSLARGELLAYSLADGRIESVAELDGFSLPNGLDAIADADAILIADEDFAGNGGVARATFDFADGTPVLNSLELRWIGSAQNVSAANGVRVIGNDVYLTDINTVKRISLDAEGSPQTAQAIYQAPTVLDDLAPYCDGLLVADFIRGLLVYVELDGSVSVESAAGFASPSAVLPDAVPLFGEGQILVTLVGGLGSYTSARGDRLVSVTAESAGLPDCTN